MFQVCCSSEQVGDGECCTEVVNQYSTHDNDSLSLYTIFKGGGQEDGWNSVFSGGAGKPGEEVQETGEDIGNVVYHCLLF